MKFKFGDEVKAIRDLFLKETTGNIVDFYENKEPKENIDKKDEDWYLKKENYETINYYTVGFVTNNGSQIQKSIKEDDLKKA